MELFEAIRTRHSVRAYDAKPVDRSLIEQVVEAGILAPTGMNRQTRRFTVIQNREKMDALAHAVGEAAGRGPGYNFYDPPVFILVSDQEDDPNGLANCACALENMMLAAQGLGLGAVWINQIGPVCQQPAVRALLTEMRLAPDQKVYGALSLGWPAGEGKKIEKNRDVVEWV